MENACRRLIIYYMSTNPITIDGHLQIHIKRLPYDQPDHDEGHFLVCSLRIVRRMGFTEYRYTLMGDMSERIGQAELITVTRRVHERELYKNTGRIVTFLEYSDEPVAGGHQLLENIFVRKSSSYQPTNFNYLI